MASRLNPTPNVAYFDPFPTLVSTIIIEGDLLDHIEGDVPDYVEFTFNADPGSTFSYSNIFLTGCSLGEITGTGLTRKATIYLKGTFRLDQVYIDVGTVHNFNIDNLAPTLTITSNVTAVKAGGTALITFSFSEDPSATFIDSDIVTTGGTLGAISGSGLIYTATFTPTASLASGTASITVAAGSYIGMSGNTGAAGTTPSISIDTLTPTVTITPSKSSLMNNGTEIVTFKFSEAVSGFDLTDISASNGSFSALSGSGSSYTATFTASSIGSSKVKVAASSYLDLAGNSGATGASASVVVTSGFP
jgi:hypothetical protein